jgi:ABC-type sulfate transport system permease component
MKRLLMFYRNHHEFGSAVITASANSFHVTACNDMHVQSPAINFNKAAACLTSKIWKLIILIFINKSNIGVHF